jgi:RNA polymerase sigma-70 factor (ECF subfamily)
MSNEQDESQHTLATHQAIEQAVRDSYGRLLAFLAARSHDVAAAEDALSDAFQSALETWPKSGVPDKPEAWLLVAARRRLIDVARHAQVHLDSVPKLLAATEQAQRLADSSVLFPDERLELLFVCAHPAIDVRARTPLMLQVVLGLDAARIAAAFLAKPSTMGQRLTRAKAKIRATQIRFEIPEPTELPERLEFVLEAIYAAYGSGWEDVAGSDLRRKGLAAEAINLCRVLVQLMPSEPEAMGLLALMLHCEARREARRDAQGAYVPLSEQDVTRWSREMITEAEHFLSEASRMQRMGRFQFEAAIQSAHAMRLRTGHTDWETVALLYEGLIRISPTVGALVARAAAVGEAHGPVAGWRLLETIPPEAGSDYQPYWALSANLLKRMGRPAESAYNRAIGLCEDQAIRAFLSKETQRKG